MTFLIIISNKMLSHLPLLQVKSKKVETPGGKLQVNVKKIPVQRNQCYIKHWDTVNNRCLTRGDNVHVCLAFKCPVSSLLCLCLKDLSRWIETKIKERNWKVKTLIFINGCFGHVIYLVFVLTFITVISL